MMIRTGKRINEDNPVTCTKAARFIFMFLLQVFHLGGLSQKQNIRFTQVGKNTGMAESNILCILQDSRGFMWFGSSDGLARYDGYSFTYYKNDKKNPRSISNDFIQSIAEAGNGDLLIGTSGGGWCRYDFRKDQFTRFQNIPGNSNTILSDDVFSVMEDNSGHVWIGSAEGLDKYDPGKKTFTHYRYNKDDSTSLGSNYVTTIFEDSHHDLWIATLNGGLNLFDRQKGTFTRFKHSRLDDRSVSSDDIYTLFEDSKKRLWIGTAESGLDLYDKEAKRFINFMHSESNSNSLANNAVRSVIESNDHKLWIGTENGGISIFDPEKHLFNTCATDEGNNNSVGSNSINSIYKDTKGSMWIGTFNAGISMADIDAGMFRFYQHTPSVNSISHNKVLCFYEGSGKNIWIGTDGGGLNLFNPLTGHFTYFRHEKNNPNSICGNYVLSVCEDSKGNIWIGTWGDGVTVYNPAKNTFKHFKNNPYDPTSLASNNAWSIMEDKEKNIWIGTYGGGLNKFDPFTKSFVSYQYDEKNEHSISDNWINSVYEDTESNIWVCTSGGGLNLFNKKTKKFTRFQPVANANSISHNNVNSILEDENKNLWITSLGGLNFLDRKTNKFTVYTTADGLPGNATFGILEDKERRLWISSNKGISCFDPVKKSFKNFSATDGLQSDKFKEQAFYKSSSGMMYFGGNNGFNQFFPGDIKTISFDPPLVITNFQVFNREVPVAHGRDDASPLKENITVTKTIVLSYQSSFFSFAFASLNYAADNKKQYAYMLEGFDKTWNEVGIQRTASYTNLDPGDYVFRVRGFNNEGKWSPAETAIKLTIVPPFWLTWWFRSAGLLFIGGVVIAIYLARVNVVKRQQKVLEQKVKEQTLQLELLNEEERKARTEADQANIELEKLNKELEQFVYIASHDLREPLRTTTSFVELFQKQYKGKLDQNADTYLSFIAGAAERMKILINDLLDYSRIGNNKELQQVDCNIVLDEVLSDLGIALKEAGAEITAGPLPVLTAHRTSIKQLFQNLTANSIKFRKKDTAPRISISAEPIDGFWKFAFADNGIGIEKQHKDKIFAIFQRLHTRNEYEGSGIGLAHCKKIVEQHKGNIWVESTPGEGSTFYFTIYNSKKS